MKVLQRWTSLKKNKNAALPFNLLQQLALGNLNGEEYTINLIDTPGHVDFTIEVERSMRVLDGAVAVFDGKEGVEAQSETVWRQADRYNVPRLCLINKMDKIGADFEFSFGNTIRDRLGANAVAVQLPIGAGDTFEGIIDLIEMKAYYFDSSEMGAVVEQREIPEDMQEMAELWKHDIVERIAELDDELTMNFTLKMNQQLHLSSTQSSAASCNSRNASISNVSVVQH